MTIWLRCARSQTKIISIATHAVFPNEAIKRNRVPGAPSPLLSEAHMLAGAVVPTIAHHLVVPGRSLYFVASEAALDAYIGAAGLQEIRGNLRQLLGYEAVQVGRAGRGKCEEHQLLENMSWLVPKQGSGEALPLLGTTAQKWTNYMSDCARLHPGKKLPSAMPAIFRKLVAGINPYDGWRRATKEEAASLREKALLRGHGASLLGLLFQPLPSPAPLPDYAASMPLPLSPQPTPPPPSPPPASAPALAPASAPTSRLMMPRPRRPTPRPTLHHQPAQRPRSTRAARPSAPAPLPNPSRPPRLSADAPPKPAAATAYRPPFHDREAQALVYLLQRNPEEAKKYCSDISPIDGSTGADAIMLSMFRKLQGRLVRVRDTPIAEGTRADRAASLFELGVKKGRPCREAAAADAAALLVGHRWRQYQQQHARKQRAATVIQKAVAKRLRVGRFTARGNAITAVQPAAIVQVKQFRTSWLPHFHCSHPAELEPAALWG